VLSVTIKLTDRNSKMTQKINITVVGCGIWGRNLVRNFYNLGALKAVCDLDQSNLENVLKDYPGVEATVDFNQLLIDDTIDGIVIATPSHTHYKFVKAAVAAGKHVYVEKPIATSSKEAYELNQIAENNEKVLMVGHLLLYHPAVNRLKSIVEEGVLGNIVYVQSDRLNINFFRNDRSVMWDLAPHDLSMISYILGLEPVSVKSAVGCSTHNNGIMDIVHLDINFPHNIHAHISNSWINPVKRVMLTIRGEKATAVFDDTIMENKIQIYSNSSPNSQMVEYPDYLEIEPLKLECQHFINCIINKVKPRSDGDNGYNVVKVLEEAEKIMMGNDLSKITDISFASSRRNSVL